MTSPSFSFASRFTRVVVLWLLAVVLPVQGAAVSVFTAKGPAHVHKPAEAPLVLEDIRRWKPAPVLRAHVFTALGHFHAGAAPQRHLHAGDDGTVVPTAADEPEADAAPGAVPVLVLIPDIAVHAPPRTSDRITPGPLWALRTGFIEPLDRPPRRA